MKSINELKALPSAEGLTLIEQIARAEALLAEGTGAISEAFERFIGMLMTFITADGWEKYGKDFAIDYNAQKGLVASSDAGRKFWEAWVRRARAERDVVKPTSDKAEKIAAKRKLEADQEEARKASELSMALELATLKGNAEKVEELLANAEKANKDGKFDDPTCAVTAQEFRSKNAEAIRINKDRSEKRRELTETLDAFAMVATHCDLSKVQKAKVEEFKALLATL